MKDFYVIRNTYYTFFLQKGQIEKLVAQATFFKHEIS